MERPIHTLSNLFAQLGEASDEEAMAQFIMAHSPLPASIRLHEAPFWSASQAAFLQAALLDDADWAEVADTLNAELHTAH